MNEMNLFLLFFAQLKNFDEASAVVIMMQLILKSLEY